MRQISKSLLIISLGIGFFAGAFLPVYAVPAAPGILVKTQPDGKKIKLRLKGDENLHWFETLQGYIVQKDKDGFWKYTKPKKDKWGFEIIKDAKVGVADPKKLGLKPRDLPDKKFRPKKIRYGPAPKK